MGKVLLKPGVILGTNLAPAGARLLDLIKTLAATYDFDITITSGRDGLHSGALDPHKTGEAFDLRSKGLAPGQVSRLLNDLRTALYLSPRRFYAFLEAQGTDNEHIHVQRRNGVVYTMDDYLNNR